MQYEVDFMPVGESHGDAICMRHWEPNGLFAVTVIDGGYADIGDSVVRHIAVHYGTSHINNLILTHADQDHAAGLVNIMNACSVDFLYMNLPWLYLEQSLTLFHGNYGLPDLIDDYKEAHPYLVELERIALRKGTRVLPIFQDTQIGPITVLAPTRERYITLVPSLRGPDPVRAAPSLQGFGDFVREAAANFADRYIEYWDVETLSDSPQPPTSASNETSVVQIAQFDHYRVLFTGDVGPVGLTEAAVRAYERGILRQPDLFQIPHQGSRHNVTPRSLDLWLGARLETQGTLRGYATCSVGTNKPSHPRKKVTNALLRRGYETQEVRASAMRFSNFERKGGLTRPDTIPFYGDTREIDDG